MRIRKRPKAHHICAAAELGEPVPRQHSVPFRLHSLLQRLIIKAAKTGEILLLLAVKQHVKMNKVEEKDRCVLSDPKYFSHNVCQSCEEKAG